MTRREESFGVVPLSREHGHWEVFLIQHQGSRYWGFPKGHAEENETPIQAALRELKEETNLECVRILKEEPFMEQYQFLINGERVLKRVFYFAAEVAGRVELQTAEINDGLWIPIPEAVEKVTHPEGKAILAAVAKILPQV